MKYIPIDASKKMYNKFIRILSQEDKVNRTAAKLGASATIMPIIEGYTYGDGGITDKESATEIKIIRW